ncbi:MAG: SUMF1/EgtB/PvdO family nonheme iron enzyme [Nitrospina sp.]|nr:SUMF1/EgtB/PvdO family nonheme iron enzyme [Nitrospina sp.]
MGILKLRKWAVAFFIAGLGASGCGEPPPPGMVLVPAGYFSMGSDEEDTGGHALSLGLDKPWYADETPQRRLHLDDFFIDRYEVTNKEYYIFTQATDRKPPRTWKGPRYPEGEDQFPVHGVSFYDAAAYAEWVGKRLPSEAEWEKAARGETPRRYPWGDQFDFNRANVSPSPRQKTGRGLKPVGSFPGGASPYGAEDMIGNVWEWVHDYYEPYPENTWHSKEYEEKKVVVRGMSYLGVGHFSKKDYVRVVAMKSRTAFREKLHPVIRRIDVGFRCARDRKGFFETYFGSDK